VLLLDLSSTRRALNLAVSQAYPLAVLEEDLSGSPVLTDIGDGILTGVGDGVDQGDSQGVLQLMARVILLVLVLVLMMPFYVRGMGRSPGTCSCGRWSTPSPPRHGGTTRCRSVEWLR
jgi:hypothetical protein